MKTLTFQSLEIEHFKSFTGAPQHLALADYNPGLHFVRGKNKLEPQLGSNGSGKSSIWDALSWCLFGCTPDGLKNPDIKPWYGDTDTRVSITMDKGGVYEIIRTTAPNKLTINGEPAGQEQVVALLGLSFDVFIHTILLGQGQPLFFDLKPQNKMQLFSDILNLERWETRAGIATEQVKTLTHEHSNVSGQLVGVIASLSHLQTMLTTTKDKSDDWERARATRLENYEQEMETLRADSETAQQKLDAAELALDSAGSELKHTKTQVKLVGEDLSAARLAENRIKDQLSDYRTRIEVWTSQYNSTKPGSGVCPTCGHTLDGKKHKQHLKDKITTFELEIAAGVPKPIVKAVTALQTKLTTLGAQHDRYQTVVDDNQRIINQVGPLLAQLKARISGLVSNQKEKRDEKNPHQDQLKEFKVKRTQLVTTQEELEQRQRVLDRKVVRTKFWVKGFKDLRLYIVNDVLQELEIITNSMLVEVGLLDWQIKYAVEKETRLGNTQRGLNVTILSPDNKDPVRWESWSGGERQRLRLIGALALAQLLLNYAGVQTNLEILDEPTQHLSPEGVQDLCEFLAGRAQQFQKQIWYCDHQSIESTCFSSVLTVHKGKLGSTLHHSG